MIKFKDLKIRKKLFIITSISLFLSAVFIYLVIYAVLPSYYYSYKKKTIDNGVNNLQDKVKNIGIEKALPLIDEFSNSNNVFVSIGDESGRILYVPETYFKLEEEDLHNKFMLNKDLYRDISGGINPLMKSYIKTKPIEIKGGRYILTVTCPLQPIDEASKVVLSLAPYILLFIFLISSIWAYIYSKLLTDPLVKINNSAKEMANLDFETKCTVDSRDEIGEISNSLNELSNNLKITMGKLESTNKKLKSDIEKEREIEIKRREFVSTISHELKSPIAAIKGQLEGMINNIGAFKDREKYLRRSYTIANNMEKLVSEILEISRMENYDFSPKVETVNVSRLVDKLIAQEEYLSLSKNLSINKNIQDNIIVNIDEKLTKKAISNIINNAMKYSPEGENINITMKVEEGNGVLTISNTGTYIQEEEISKIFDPFYRIEKSRNRSTGGSGLGLYIVKKILDIQNITYSIESRENMVEFKIIFHI